MMEESLPPGFRFHPSDEELITHYLTCKVSDVSFATKAIADVDLNKCEPWDLPGTGKASMGEKEWYFFSLRDRKYPTGLRTNRATQAGYWKTTGKDKEIYRGGALLILVGMKKTLVFYRGRAPKGEKTNWVMHEYRLENKHSFKSTKEEWVVCRVFQKSIVVRKPPPFDQSPNDKNEVGDMEVTVANSSSTNMIASAQHYNTNDQNHFGNMNWEAAPSLSPSYPLACSNNNLLSSNLAVNSLLVKALQLRAREANYGRYLETQGMSNFGIMACDQSSNFEASSSQTHQEQPFHLDSIW